MAGGYMGKILKVDLSQEQITILPLLEEEARDYLGGSGLAAKWLYELSKPEIGPLDERSPLIFLTGPLTGSMVPLSGRHAVVARSPLTGIFGESDVGGRWGNMLKRSGFDGIIVVGKAQGPVYLWVNDGKTQIRSAAHFWGKDIFEVDEELKQETNAKAVTGLIGQAGEGLAKISSIIFDGIHARAAGRCGLGAVMGSKNLKGVVVFGTSKPAPADAQGLRKALAGKVKDIASRTTGLRDFGTSGSVIAVEKRGDLPVHNWLRGSWEEGAESIAGQRMAETILYNRFFCFSCPIGCGRHVKITEGKYAPVDGAGPEYETLGIFGGNCGVRDLEAIVRANDLCNRYGLDTISTGGVIAMAMEAFEKGIITKDDTGGMEITWGDPDVLIWLIKQIGTVTGIGVLLSQGVKVMAEELGPEAEEMAIHAKGLEFPAHDPRGHYSQALSYATSTRGADHCNSFSHNFDVGWTMPDLGYSEVFDQFAVEGKSELVYKLQNLMAVYDAIKMCKFAIAGNVSVNEQAQWLSMVTGWDYDLDSLMLVGERLFNLKRMYNVRMGISRKDDTLPKRILTHPRGEGLAADALPPLDEMLAEYYPLRGWDETGKPTQETLERLGLEWTTEMID